MIMRPIEDGRNADEQSEIIATNRINMPLNEKVKMVIAMKYSLNLLLYIEKNPNRTKREIIDANMTEDYVDLFPSKRTKFTRLTDLQDVGLIKVDSKPRQFNAMLVSLTEEGEEIAKIIRELYSTIDRLYTKDE